MSGRLVSSTDTIHADSLRYTSPLLHSLLKSTKIIHSLNLIDAIIDDSFTKMHLDS